MCIDSKEFTFLYPLITETLSVLTGLHLEWATYIYLHQFRQPLKLERWFVIMSHLFMLM